MQRKTPSLNSCRICGATTSPANPEYPFCGAACRERDLGNWASESYRVSTSTANDEDPRALTDSSAQFSVDD
jgi:endogenous inhibitor of DNA gyrase (YacG/DUF329 family)